MKDKLNKAKEWAKNHKLELQEAGFIAGVVALYAGVCVVAIKVHNKQVAEEKTARQELVDAVARNARILPGPDGHWWILEEQV